MLLENEITTITVITAAVLLILLSTALYTDLRYGKIYNKLTLPAIAVGILLNVAASGLQGLLYSLGGAVLVMVLYLIFAPASGIGGGDTKLMMAVGALMGIKLLIWALLFSAVFGGVMALAVMAKYRMMLSTTKQIASNLMMRLLFRAPLEVTAGSKKISFRYSPAIAMGTVLALLWRP